MNFEHKNKKTKNSKKMCTKSKAGSSRSRCRALLQYRFHCGPEVEADREERVVCSHWKHFARIKINNSSSNNKCNNNNNDTRQTLASYSVIFSAAFFSICNFLRPITPMPMAMADAAGAGGAAATAAVVVAAAAELWCVTTTTTTTVNNSNNANGNLYVY